MDWLVELLDKIPVEALVAAWGFSVVVNRIVAGGISPIFERKGWDRFWLMYIAWALAALVIIATGINIFEPYIPIGLIGQIFTAIVVGGLANFQHDRTDNNLAISVSGFRDGAEVEIDPGD